MLSAMIAIQYLVNIEFIFLKPSSTYLCPILYLYSLRIDEFNKTGHYMILVSVSGSAQYKGHSGWKLFYESFMLKAFGDKWKIVSDCYRFAE